MIESEHKDGPRTLKRAEVREEREGFLREPCIEGLTEFVEKMREEEAGQGENIPYFDPLDGGTEARCLFLFEAAGGKAVESGFVSRNNNDQSANNFFCLNEEVGLNRTLTVLWNIVPWALRETGKNRSPRRDDIRQGLHRLEEPLDLLRQLEVVVLCGGAAQKATPFFYKKHAHLDVLHAPHPGAQSLNQPGKREHLRAAIRKAASKVSG